MLDRTLAETYAGWFRALADPTRVQILNLIASARNPLTVGQVVEQVPVGQSTVSAHLKILAQAGFLIPDRQGITTIYRVNERCIACFPSAADVVMGSAATTVTALMQAAECEQGTS
jgi:DNA-binding transcriptional ArsR family regulator